ncbi:MAG: UDP-N-acetylglucosamine--N-acetylmuramyl-(pentapeptide) pyrophosphoryl-undecaprenol N-acetylglucosamine transferase [Bdellovibrionales bacterium]|nr:UDP-N-acetylglucosamine--N-acetylmuramyl-(pentapeptide) pyrophosphoryl-undecaprenol N-acetylglucosamine transferase [Bdellovibrionales bacterium]
MEKKSNKILIAAGGTGGHILPALAIADGLKHIDKSCRIEFVRGSSLLEKNIYSRCSFVTHCLSVGRLRKNVKRVERWKTFISLPFILLKALILLIKLKPSLVIGTGGAVSGPLLLAAFLLRKKTIIFEFNVIPGLTNRWLSYIVDEVIFVFSTTKKYFPSKAKKHTQFPFPIRSAISQVSIKNQPDHPLRILVLGGSQGSFVINKVVSEFIVSEDTSRFSFVHQAGERDFESLKKIYSVCDNVRAFSFLHNIHEVYAWADLVIGRAGMGTIAEISAVGRAGIVIPLASSADQHQLKNAQDLEYQSAIICVKEEDFNKEELKSLLTSLVNNPQKISRLSACVHDLKLGATADNIAGYLLKRFF